MSTPAPPAAPTPASQAAPPPAAPKMHLGMELDEEGVPIANPFKNSPCDEAKQNSYKCLTSNNYDNTACEPFFEAYRECRKFWGEQKKYYRETKYKVDRAKLFKW
mmetsp:Transcript_24188/g.63152  ORF Transcript_24188/g.63152 Transcript_24188/m.63152 type:complete len:105 (-) Transcript_24188:1137-1451(-)